MYTCTCIRNYNEWWNENSNTNTKFQPALNVIKLYPNPSPQNRQHTPPSQNFIEASLNILIKLTKIQTWYVCVQHHFQCWTGDYVIVSCTQNPSSAGWHSCCSVSGSSQILGHDLGLDCLKGLTKSCFRSSLGKINQIILPEPCDCDWLLF